MKNSGIHTIPANWVLITGPSRNQLLQKITQHGKADRPQKLIGIFSEQTQITQGEITTEWFAIFENIRKPGDNID